MFCLLSVLSVGFGASVLWHQGFWWSPTTSPRVRLRPFRTPLGGVQSCAAVRVSTESRRSFPESQGFYLRESGSDPMSAQWHAAPRDRKPCCCKDELWSQADGMGLHLPR